MGWLETIWGISPDGGSGATEVVFCLGLLVSLAIAFAARGRAIRAWHTR